MGCMVVALDLYWVTATFGNLGEMTNPLPEKCTRVHEYTTLGTWFGGIQAILQVAKPRFKVLGLRFSTD